MIKIQLCPVDELESQFWWVPDVGTCALVFLLSFFSVQYYLGSLQDDIDASLAKKQSLVDSTKKLEPDLLRFKELKNNISELNSKLEALKSITISKVARYKPVIVLEHLQNLKPEGVWFKSLRLGFFDVTGKVAKAQATPKTPATNPPTKEPPPTPADAPGETFEVKGQAFDSILTAELVTAMRATDTQEVDEADMRTQVFFTNLEIGQVKVERGTSNKFSELDSFPDFVISGRLKERFVAAKPEGLDPPKQKPPAAEKKSAPNISFLSPKSDQKL